MSEYADHLLSAIDNCYELLKKRRKNLLDKTNNPYSLFEGKQLEKVSCKCGKMQQSIAEKPTSFQSSYITLTTSLFPITNVTFETRNFEVGCL